MSENVKSLSDPLSPASTNSSDPLSLDTSLMQAAEARMRRALGLDGGAAKPRPQERQEPQQRQVERFVPGHNGHKRRFVQDGDVPVTVVSGRRDGAAEMTPHRGPSVTAAPSRLEAAEQALAHEAAARQQAERLLTEAQATLHDLQTKLGHAELARVEAAESLRREQETSVALRAELRACEERLQAAEASRPAQVRRGRPPHAAVADIQAPEVEDDDTFVAVPPQPPRRGRPAGKKPAPKSKLVRWWIKDDAKPD